MASGIRDIDLGLNQALRNLSALGALYTDVGVQSDAGTDREGASIALRAFANEFGFDRIPERSFIRSSFDEQLAELNELKARLTGAVIDGDMSPGRAIGLLGQTHEAKIKQKIVDVREPPNAPATLHPSVGGLNLQGKRSTNPLVDTGQMRQSVRYKIGAR